MLIEEKKNNNAGNCLKTGYFLGTLTTSQILLVVPEWYLVSCFFCFTGDLKEKTFWKHLEMWNLQGRELEAGKISFMVRKWVTELE